MVMPPPSPPKMVSPADSGAAGSVRANSLRHRRRLPPPAVDPVVPFDPQLSLSVRAASHPSFPHRRRRPRRTDRSRFRRQRSNRPRSNSHPPGSLRGYRPRLRSSRSGSVLIKTRHRHSTAPTKSVRSRSRATGSLIDSAAGDCWVRCSSRRLELRLGTHSTTRRARESSRTAGPLRLRRRRTAEVGRQHPRRR